MEQQQREPINPHLADLFRTAIDQGKPTTSEPPSIVVNGSNNVISWGGTVYMGQKRANEQL